MTLSLSCVNSDSVSTPTQCVFFTAPARVNIVKKS